MLLENIVRDVRIGLRVLNKEKSFCALAVLVLALGIAGVTTMFSVVNGTLLRGFSFPNAARLAAVQFIDVTQKDSGQNGFRSQIFSLDYEALREQQNSFDRFAAFTSGATVNATVDDSAHRYTGGYVTEDFFRVLGVAPALGRDLTVADNQPGAEPVALLSHSLWQRDFGGSREVLGKNIRLNGKSATVIGVMPPGFGFPANEELWLPLYSAFPPAARNSFAAGNQVRVLALVKPGLGYDRASADCNVVAQQLAAAFPDTNKKFNTAIVQPLINTFTPPNLRGRLWTMLAFCVGILALACVNVMNMQFARATVRAKALAIRSSLGATRWRLIRQMLTENLLVATLGAAPGVALAAWATDYLTAVTHQLSNPVAAYITFDLDRPVLFVVVAATMLSAVVSGLIPAWISSRAKAGEALRESDRGTTSGTIARITRGLVVFQVLVTCVLLTGAMLQLQSIVRQQRIDYGYDTDGVLAARVGLMDADYPTAETRKLLFDRLLRGLRASSEFEFAALTNRFRMTSSGAGKIEIEGRTYQADDSDRPNADFEQISEGYFATLGTHLIAGRDFALDDSDAKQPVAIVNAAFAKKHFVNGDAVGRRFRTVASQGKLFGPWRTIVGIAPTLRMIGPADIPGADDAGFYLPYFSAIFGSAKPGPISQQFATVIVKPRASRAALLGAAFQREVQKVDANLPLYFLGTARENQDTFIAQSRIVGAMFTLFGIVAVVLAAVGLYGVTSYSVNQRTPEFGIRLALGADPGRILCMVLKQGGVQLGAGLALGLGLTAIIALAFRDSISSQLFETSPTDPLTYTAVAFLLAAVSLVATLIPARRAATVDPTIALRSE